jgi:hypothetical protein
MQLILEHWNIPTALLPMFTNDPDGLAVLALLCNAGAKDWPHRPCDPRLYALKADLVARACRAAGTERFWIAEHEYARATRWPWMNRLNAWWREHTGTYLFGAERMYIIFVETGLELDGDQLQLAFHFRAGDRLPDLPAWPEANGRGWRKQQAQPRALSIAWSYLMARGVLIGGQ